MFLNRNFSVIFSSYYKGNVVYAKDSWLSKNLYWWRSENGLKFMVINLGGYLKSTREALHSKLVKEKNLRKYFESFYTFLKTPDEVGKYV